MTPWFDITYIHKKAETPIPFHQNWSMIGEIANVSPPRLSHTFHDPRQVQVLPALIRHYLYPTTVIAQSVNERKMNVIIEDWSRPHSPFKNSMSLRTFTADIAIAMEDGWVFFFNWKETQGEFFLASETASKPGKQRYRFLSITRHYPVGTDRYLEVAKFCLPRRPVLANQDAPLIHCRS